MHIYTSIRNANWILVLYGTMSGVFGFIVLMMCSIIALPSFQTQPKLTVVLLFVGFFASAGCDALMNVLRLPEWDAREIDTIRRLASAGWIVVSDNGHYSIYGPDNVRQWLDHWRDVEEFAKGLAQC